MRRTAKFGVFVVGLVLALSVPVVALALNTARFSGFTPARGSTISTVRPTISVVVYDQYGVHTGGAYYSMTLNGVSKPVSISRFSGYGYKKFRLSYVVPADLPNGVYTVQVKVRDFKQRNSTATWTFTVGGFDHVAPVTTTDAHLNYIVPNGSVPSVPSAFDITLDASDNAGGSGVFRTYYILDKAEGGVQSTYEGAIPVPAPGVTPSLHSLEYWSVDVAGNVETHHVFYFFVQRAPMTFAQNHASPTSLGLVCTNSGCHDSDLWTIHSGSEAATTVAGIEYVGCSLCHNTNPNMPATTNNCVTCHGELVHADHIPILSSGQNAVGSCTSVSCHGTNFLGVHSVDGCATCHSSSNAVVAAAVEMDSGATCETCHGVQGGADLPSHDNPNHQVTTANGCISTLTFCHDTHDAGSAVDFHPSCWNCHDVEEVDVPINCTQCHDPILVTHLQTRDHTTTSTCATGNAPGCHDVNVAVTHGAGNCVFCHANGETPSTDCLTCHPTGLAVHNTETLAVANAAHVSWSSFGCALAGCHSSDVSLIHNGGVSAPRPGCADCHKAGTTLTTPILCANCHAAFLSVAHYPQPSDATRTTHHLNTSALCTTCHNQTTGMVSCSTAGCHTGAVVGTTVTRSNGTTYTATDLPAEFDLGLASRHNVSEFGGTALTGVKTRFDGSQGVLLKDTLEDTVTTTWAFPEVNVFWSSRAIRDGQAPASAMVGLTKDSVISCLDCHISPQGAVGPHGSTYEWLIDPNYPGDYKYATLGARKGTTEDTSTSGIKFNTLMTDAPGRTLRIGEASMGPLPLLQTYRNQGNFPAVLADGTKGDHAVICAKCHDLYNAGTGCDGWSNAYSEQSTPGAPVVLDEPSPESIHGMHAGGTTVDTEIRLAQRGGNQGRTDGRGDCINCHIAVPHGWKRPRLLVNGYTGEYAVESGVAQSVADPFPYWQGVGQYISEGNSPGNGPIDATEDHELNVQGVPVWSEQRCISCSDGAFYESGGVEENGLEHSGFPTSPAKLK